jgi:hypothetical protein
MSIFDSTRVAYGAGIPTITGTVTLFNSVTAFPPGGSFHLLGQQWFQFSLRTASAGGTATGTVTGSYSTDKGVTWIPFYSKATADAVAASTATVADVFTDDVYVGAYKDIRFQYTNAVEVLTVFDPLLSLHSKKPVSKVADGASLGGGTPVTITGGAITSWMRLADPASVITGSGYSSIRDVLNTSSPLTQSTDARRPPASTSANGYPILNVTASNLTVPLIAARVNTATWGWWGWIQQASTADGLISIGVSGGASANFAWVNWNTSGTNTKTELWTGASSRVFNKGSLTAGTWKFFTVEYNSAFAADARYIITVDTVVQSGTFSGSLGSMPASLPSGLTGTGSLLSFGSGATFPFVGKIGPNFGFFGAAMPGAVSGLLTADARAQLMAYEAPT